MTEIHIDVSNEAFLTRSGILEYACLAHAAIVEATSAARRPSVLYRPILFADGDAWCVLLGPDLMDGVAGFGSTPAEAMAAFDAAFANANTPVAMLRKRATNSDGRHD